MFSIMLITYITGPASSLDLASLINLFTIVWLSYLSALFFTNMLHIRNVQKVAS